MPSEAVRLCSHGVCSVLQHFVISHSEGMQVQSVECSKF